MVPIYVVQLTYKLDKFIAYGMCFPHFVYNETYD